MQSAKHALLGWLRNLILAGGLACLAGCISEPKLKTEPVMTKPPAATAAPSQPATTPTPTPAAIPEPVAMATVPPAQAANPAEVPVKPPVRIKAGPSEPFKDADGNQWISEHGFEEGNTVERPDLEIANTKTPAIYHSERYNMSSFSYPVPNGKYIVKLHFCETYEGITGPGQRVFSYNVEGKEFKDFDLFVKSGGSQRAYIETVNVEVTDGKLDIKFTPNIEYPEINGIEILPGG
jgi:Malectin domain